MYNKHLDAFMSVVEKGSFSKAAEREGRYPHHRLRLLQQRNHSLRLHHRRRAVHVRREGRHQRDGYHRRRHQQRCKGSARIRQDRFSRSRKERRPALHLRLGVHLCMGSVRSRHPDEHHPLPDLEVHHAHHRRHRHSAGARACLPAHLWHHDLLLHLPSSA